AHHVLELPNADAAGISIAADANGGQAVVGKRCAGRQRRHATMQAVNAARLAEEVGGSLAGAANPAQFDNLCGLERKIIGDRDDAGRDRVVSAAFAERGRSAFVVGALKANQVDIRARRRNFYCHSINAPVQEWPGQSSGWSMASRRTCKWSP